MARKYGNIDRIQWQAPKDAAPTDASTTPLIPENQDRVGLLVVNDGAVDIYLCIGVPAQLNKGIFLAANGGSYEINMTNLSVQAIFGIVAATLTGSITFQEAI